MKEESNYLFVIDTNEYAGNFGRQMCAYLTGEVGECGGGKEMAELFHKEVNEPNLFVNVASCSDEDGCSRPAIIYPNPRYANNGIGGAYLLKGSGSKEIQKKLVANYVKEIEEKEIPYIERYEGYIKEFKAGRSVVGWTLADAERELAKLKNDIEKAKKLKKVAKNPAYQSVGIWFETEPTTKQIKLMKERALKLAKIYKEYGIKIEGFRLINFKKTKSEKKITI